MSRLLHELLADTADRTPEREAVVDGSRRLTYGAYASAVRRCAGVLHAHGLRRRDRVAVLLPKSFEECWALFGTSRAGGVFVPVNPILRPAQVRHILADCGVRFLVTDAARWDAVAEVARDLPALERVLLTDRGSSETPADTPTVVPGAFEEERSPNPIATLAADLAAILYTSGSTGPPKGVMLSHRNLVAGARIVSSYLEIEASDRILSVLPASFDYGLNQLTTAARQGASVVLLTFHFGDEVVRTLGAERITVLAGVPTLWTLLTRGAPTLSKTELPHLRCLTNSGGALPTDTLFRLRELLAGAQIVLMYGLTEAFRSTYLPPGELERRPTSIGKAIPECEVFAINPAGDRCAPGEEGILVHRGPTVFLGYWNRPEDTAEVLRPDPLVPAAEGGGLVCYSGDRVVQDEDGYFRFLGREDAMIKSSGYRISPTEVEEVLMATGCFREVAVIGLPDPTAGARVHAVAVALETPPAVDALAACAEALPPHMVPREVETVAALPRSPNGKVDYRALVRERTKAATGA